MDFTLDELKAIANNRSEGWRRIGDPSAYGGIYENPDLYPGKVVKIQEGKFNVYDNEVAKQFEAALRAAEMNPEYEVPKVGRTGFYPTKNGLIEEAVYGKMRPGGVSGISPDQSGVSFIEMDKADFAETSPNPISRLAKSQALIDLYRNTGIIHNDVHGGNIKFNPKSNKGVLLDFALSKNNADTAFGDAGFTYKDQRLTQLQTALAETNNRGMLQLFNEAYGDLLNDYDSDPGPKTKAALMDLIEQGEEVASRVSTKIDPVFPTDVPLTRGDKSFVITQQGAADWKIVNPFENSDPSWPSTRQLNTRGATPANATNNFGGRMAGLAWGAAEAIPSAESIRMLFEQGVGPAAKQYGREQILGAPVGAGVGLVSAAVPAIGPYALAAGGAAILSNTAEAGNELVRQTTGESALSKLRQAIGTKKRTGYSGKGASLQERIAADQAQIRNPPTVQRLGDNKTKLGARKSIDEMSGIQAEAARRLRMAADRLNPARLEFGLTELLFGR